MNYVRTILITIALLNMQYLYNGQAPFAQNSDSFFDDIDNSLQPTQETTVDEASTKETKAIDKWNNHLELLTSDDDYWDTPTNNPTPDWKATAFKVAEEVIKQDKGLAETLKTDFINALNKKTTQFIHISNLITEFSNFIDTLLSAPEVLQEITESTPPAPIVSETIIPSVPEPVVEPTPAQTETSEATSAAEGGTTSPAGTQNNQEPNQAQLQQTWNDLLKKLKTEGVNWVQIDDILMQTYQAAKELLKVGKITEYALQQQFLAALGKRAANQAKSEEGILKGLYPLDINDAMYSFNASIGIPQNQFDQPYRFPEPSTFEPISPGQQGTVIKDERVEKLQKALDEKDAKFKAEQKKAEEDRLIMRKAAQDALEKGTLAQEQVQKLTQAQNKSVEARKKIDEEYEKKREADLKEIQQARKSLMDYRQQIAVAQKADAEKGIFSKLKDWWQGTSAQKPGELSSQDEKDLLSKMVMNVPDYLKEDAKETFKNFQNTLFNFDNNPFWDNQQSIPNLTWIAKMDGLIKDMVITYKLMGQKEIRVFVESILQKSGKISPTALQNIMYQIQIKTNQVLAEKKRKKAAKQEVVQRRQEKKEQILLAQQRAQAEKNRIEAEKQKRIHAANTYKQEKKQWHSLLNKVAHNKQATLHDNHTHMQEALQKSQLLLQLASDIPHKNKPAISQKLKQKFSVALLEQQKSGDGLVNVHHNMDLFNTEINKMLD